jgi:hypothetical protein
MRIGNGGRSTSNWIPLSGKEDMVKFVIAIFAFMAAVVFMTLALYFSNYKRGRAVCCGDEAEDSSNISFQSDACRLCLNRDESAHDCKASSIMIFYKSKRRK